MYLKSQYELNQGKKIKSQPHGSEPLSPQTNKEKKKIPQNERKNPASLKKKNKKNRESHAHRKKPLKPTRTQTQDATIWSSPHPTKPLAPEHKEPLPPHSWSEVPSSVPTRNWSRIVHRGRTATKKRPNQSLPAFDPTKNAQVHSGWG